MTDDVLEEVRRARLAYGEQFGFDLGAIGRDLREQERRSGREIISLAPKRIVPRVDIPPIEQTSSDPGSIPTSTVGNDS